jgi:hypothetical protein
MSPACPDLGMDNARISETVARSSGSFGIYTLRAALVFGAIVSFIDG